MTDKGWVRLGVALYQWRQEQACHVQLVHKFSVEELTKGRVLEICATRKRR